MECSDFIQHLCSYLDGDARPDLAGHLSACRSCRCLAESCLQTIRFYRAQPAPELPAALHQRVMDHLGRRMPPSSHKAHPKR